MLTANYKASRYVISIESFSYDVLLNVQTSITPRGTDLILSPKSGSLALGFRSFPQPLQKNAEMVTLKYTTIPLLNLFFIHHLQSSSHSVQLGNGC